MAYLRTMGFHYNTLDPVSHILDLHNMDAAGNLILYDHYLHSLGGSINVAIYNILTDRLVIKFETSDILKDVYS